MSSVLEAVLSQSRKELIEQGVLKEGHFQRHDGKHVRWYFDTQPLVFTGALWRIVQDLVAITPVEILEQVEIVAGPQSVGDVLAEGMINIISSRGPKARQVFCVPIERQFKLVGKKLGKTVYLIRPFYRERLAGKKVLFVDNVFASGKTTVKCTRLIEEAGATIVGLTYIADLSPVSDNHRRVLWQDRADDVYPQFACPMCKSGIPITKF